METCSVVRQVRSLEPSPGVDATRVFCDQEVRATGATGSVSLQDVGEAGGRICEEGVAVNEEDPVGRAR